MEPQDTEHKEEIQPQPDTNPDTAMPIEENPENPEKFTEQQERQKRQTHWLQAVKGWLITLGICYVALVLYASDYYRAEDIAIQASTQEGLEVQGKYTILKGDSDTGIIFYPGAKVEAISYLPLLQQLQEEGFTCVLVEMPFHMAIFNSNAADKVFDMGLDVEKWYISGHSMGGGMASSYASKHPEKVEGLLLMGAYIYGDYPVEKTLTIYGSYNSNLEEKMDYTENIFLIEGGNHAKFGNYGVQEGDHEGDITTEEQQRQTVEAIVDFVGW